MSDFPLRYLRQNILVGPGGEEAGLYRLRTVSYPYLSPVQKSDLARRLVSLVSAIGTDFSLWRVSREYPARRYLPDTQQLLDERGQDPEVWQAYLQGHERHLARLAAHVPEVYLAVSLGNDRPAARLGSRLVRGVDRARRRASALARPRAAGPLDASELDGLAGAEQHAFDRLRGLVALTRARTREIQWLLRRTAIRGVSDPALERHWDPDALVITAADGRVHYQPLERDVWRLVNAPMCEPRQAPARLVIEDEQLTSHQAMLCLGSLADAPVFPGPVAEFLYAPLQALAFPVDAVLHARFVSNRDALAQVRKRITDVEHAYREQAEGTSTGVSWQREEDRVLAREYEATLQSSARPPMLNATVSLAVGADSETELERRVVALRDHYGELALYRPRGMQEALYMDHLPRADGGRVGDYRQQMTAAQFGAAVALGTDHVGSARGIYIGHTTAGRGTPVFYDVTEPSREARTSAVLLAGTLGSGKTVAAQLIAYTAERRGSVVIDLDPKPDHGLHRIPGLKDRVAVLELTGAPEHRGRLDPLSVGLEDLREELCCSYLLELLRDAPPSWENQIQRAVRDVVRHHGHGSLQVISALRDSAHPAAIEAADALEVIADFGLARLGFGDASQSVHAASAPVTTIRTPGLTLPDPLADRGSYTRAERVSVATLSLVAAYALRLVASDRSRHKVVLLDEAWFLLASPQGRTVINRLVRLGRAFNATVLLATQRLADLGELSDLIGTHLIFGQESDAEAARALGLLGLDPADRNLLARLRGLRRGRCLMRDLHGRVGELQVDCADPTLLAALDTTPTREQH